MLSQMDIRITRKTSNQPIAIKQDRQSIARGKNIKRINKGTLKLRSKTNLSGIGATAGNGKPGCRGNKRCGTGKPGDRHIFRAVVVNDQLQFQTLSHAYSPEVQKISGGTQVRTDSTRRDNKHRVGVTSADIFASQIR